LKRPWHRRKVGNELGNPVGESLQHAPNKLGPGIAAAALLAGLVGALAASAASAPAGAALANASSLGGGGAIEGAMLIGFAALGFAALRPRR
jgi:hypothetical protein